MGIRGRLLLSYFAVIFILIASGAVIVVRMGREVRLQVERDAETLSATLMEEIDRVMYDRIQVVRVFAGTSRVLHRELARSNAEFAAIGAEAEIRAEIRRRDDAWTAATSETAFMRGILRNELSAYLKERKRYHEGVDDQPVFGEIFATNRYGANVGQTNRTEDYEQRDERWWKEAWNADSGLWVNNKIEEDQSAGINAIDIAVRIEAGGQRLGVLKAVLNVTVLERIIDRFDSRSRLRRARVELVDSHGSLIHRQGERHSLGEDLSQERAIKLALSGHRDSIVESTPRGKLLRAFARSGSPVRGPRLGWVLVLNQPTDRAYASAYDLQRWMLGVGVLGSLFAILVGLFLARTFERINTSLRRSEARVQSIVSSVVDGIVTIGPDGKMETVNPAVMRIFGYTQDELIGSDISMLLPPSGDEGDNSGLRASLLAREAVGRRRDGSTFPLDLAVGEVPDEDFSVHRFVAVLRDVTDRHEARKALHEAKEAAETASRSKGEFLANMSHELRTPLNAIIGYTEMVTEELQERGDTELSGDLQKVHQASRNLLTLINDVLDVSKLEAGRTEIHTEEFDFGQFLREVAGTVRPLVEANANELDINVSGGFGRVRTDKVKLRQILLNLLSNATKFTRDGKIALTVRRPSRDPLGWVEITVADTGIGMTPDQLAHVWDAFAQADSSTTREYGGTGLGLTITRSFCELLGGGIGVDSELGEGTTFTLRLPLAEPEREPEPAS